jgi:hypothetical protein
MSCAGAEAGRLELRSGVDRRYSGLMALQRASIKTTSCRSGPPVGHSVSRTVSLPSSPVSVPWRRWAAGHVESGPLSKIFPHGRRAVGTLGPSALVEKDFARAPKRHSLRVLGLKLLENRLDPADAPFEHDLDQHLGQLETVDQDERVLIFDDLLLNWA